MHRHSSVISVAILGRLNTSPAVGQHFSTLGDDLHPGRKTLEGFSQFFGRPNYENLADGFGAHQRIHHVADQEVTANFKERLIASGNQALRVLVSAGKYHSIQ